MADTHTPANKVEKETPKSASIMTDKDAKAPHINPLVQKIPDGAIDPQDLRPGYGPLEGSPKENDPTKLANPENPNSPITKPVNPSNPANMPATQSEKPASEVRMYNDILRARGELKDEVSPEAKKTQENLAKEKAELLKKVDACLKEFGNESQIPSNSPYWADINRLRSLSSQ